MFCNSFLPRKRKANIITKEIDILWRPLGVGGYIKHTGTLLMHGIKLRLLSSQRINLFGHLELFSVF